MTKAVGIAVAAGFLLGAAANDGPLWRPAGPFGGGIVFVQAASEPGRLYAGTFAGQAFGSGDGGQRWNSLPGITPFAGLSADLAIPLAAAPNDAETVYFRFRRGTSEHLLQSRDGGSRFAPIETGLDLSSRFSYDLAIEPDNARHLLLATSDGLFRSRDGGDSWREAAFAGSGVLSIAFDPRRPAKAAATVESGEGVAVWRSTDSGATWTPTASPPRWTSISRVSWSPNTEGTFFVAANGRPFVTHDLGASFTLLPLERRDIRDLAELGDGTLLAATSSGIFRSEDGGLSWSPSGPEGVDSARLQVEILRVEAASGTLEGAYAAGIGGLFRSEDSGRTWVPANRGIRALSTVALVGGAAPSAVFYGAGIFQLAESGWQSTGAGPVVRLGDREFPVGGVGLVAADPGDPKHLLANLGRKLGGSRDGGKNWQILFPQSPLNFNADVVVFAPSDPRRVYAAGISSIGIGHGPEPCLYRSLDRGVTWMGVNAFDSLLALAVDPRDPNRLFAAAEGRFAVSRNGGRHWLSTGRGLPGSFESTPKDLRIDPANPNRLLLANDDQVWQSLDDGVSFSPFGQSFEGETIERLELDTSGIYLSVLNRGIFRYDPTIGRWKLVGHRLPAQLFFGRFTLDPNHPGRLFAAIDGGGLLRLDLAP